MLTKPITWRIFLFGRAADDVRGEDVAAASCGDSHAVAVVFEDVVGHVGVEIFHHRHISVTAVVDVVACELGRVGFIRVRQSVRHLQ